MSDLWGQTINFGGVLLGDQIVISAKTRKGTQDTNLSFGGIVLDISFPYIRPVAKVISLTGPQIWYSVGIAGATNENRLQVTLMVADPETYKTAIEKFIDLCATDRPDYIVLEVTPASCANRGQNAKKITFRLRDPFLSVHQVQMRSENPPALAVALAFQYSSLEVAVS